MRPNGRTIYKVLMRGRQSVFWGRRAFVTVRLPTSVLPVPCPSTDYCKEWGDELSGGMWEKDLGDGVSEYHYITQLSSGGNPLENKEEGDSAVHFLTEEDMGHDYTSFSWWEGTVRRVKDDDRENAEQEELPVEVIAAHRAVHDWHEKYMNGTVPAERGVVLDAFLDASNAAKTHYTALSEEGQFLYITYSVKWFYKDRARRFCADLKRAFRVATENNINAKLIR